MIWLLIFWALPIWANAFTIQTQLRPLAEMAPDQIYYSYRTLPFNDWSNRAEKDFLNLYPGFRDGMVPVKGKTKLIESKDIILFIAKASMILDKPSDAIHYQSLLDLKVMQKLQNGSRAEKGYFKN